MQLASTPVVLTDGNSSTTINLTSQAGNNSWVVDGVDQYAGGRAGQQWFWYSIGNSAPASIDTLTNTFLFSNANTMNTTYSGNGFTLNLKETLVGGSIGDGSSAISEVVTVDNSGVSPLSFHLYHYVDLNLAGTSGNDSLTMSGTPVNTADQTDPLGSSAEVSVTNPDEFQAGKFGTITSLLNGGAPVTLNDSGAPVTGNVDFAFQWDPTIQANGSFQASINKNLTGASATAAVPLPAAANTALAMLAGLGLVGFVRRARKSIV
ncbi:MAG: hypothetical protein M3O30_00455 [Planctomycetota bacterium]|nr:hypothetical protein [Planctomycetota bacterium]